MAPSTAEAAAPTQATRRTALRPSAASSSRIEPGRTKPRRCLGGLDRQRRSRPVAGCGEIGSCGRELNRLSAPRNRVVGPTPWWCIPTWEPMVAQGGVEAHLAFAHRLMRGGCGANVTIARRELASATFRPRLQRQSRAPSPWTPSAGSTSRPGYLRTTIFVRNAGEFAGNLIQYSIRSDALRPIARPSLIVGNRQDEDEFLLLVLLHAIENAVRESGDQISASLAEHSTSCSWVGLEATDTVLDRIQEDLAEALGLSFVEGRRFEQLSPGQRMPRDRGHLSRVRACSNTAADGIPCTAPALSSS